MSVDLKRLRNLAGAVRERTQAAASQQRTHGGRSWYRFENKAGDRAEVYVYDYIGEWGVSAQDFVNELRDVRASALDVHINSEGGEVFDGLAIYEALRQHRGDVTVYVDGLAASSASFIAMAGDKVIMAERARLMIHDAHAFCIGNASDMRACAAILDDLSDNIADIYADRAGGTRAEWRETMRGTAKADDGTWFDAEAAVEAGLADEIAKADERTSRRGRSAQEESADRLDVTGIGATRRESVSTDPAPDDREVIVPIDLDEVLRPDVLLGIFKAVEHPAPVIEPPDPSDVRSAMSGFRIGG